MTDNPVGPKKGWMDHFLKSGVPLEHEVAAVMSGAGMPVDADFSFLRPDVAGDGWNDGQEHGVAEPFAISLAAASKHIKVLENAGLIRREVRGRTHLCRLDPGPLASAHEWLGFYERFWTSRLDVLEQLLRAEDASKSKKPKSKKPASKSRSGKGDK